MKDYVSLAKNTQEMEHIVWKWMNYFFSQERERPQFVQAIEKKIQAIEKNSHHYNVEKQQSKQSSYKMWNNILERYEYIQPRYLLVPKIVTTFSILFTLVSTEWYQHF